MTLDRIKQDANIIIESLYGYESLLNEKRKLSDKTKIKKIDVEIENLKKYILSFTTEIRSLLNEERLNFLKNGIRP